MFAGHCSSLRAGREAAVLPTSVMDFVFSAAICLATTNFIHFSHQLRRKKLVSHLLPATITNSASCAEPQEKRCDTLNDSRLLEVSTVSFIGHISSLDTHSVG